MIAANILSIRLRNLIREEKSGVYDIQVAAELTEELKDEAVTTITFVCDPKRKEELLSAIDSAIATFVKKGVTSEELYVVKKMILLAYRNQVDRNGFWVDGMMASYRFHTPIETLVTFPKIIAGIQAASVQKVAKALFAGDRLIATLMPHR
jgi:zinc protease